MKTEEELNQKIIKTIEKIRRDHPELVKYIGDMPIKSANSGDDDPTIKNLEEYHKSLLDILTKYAPNHKD